VIIGTAAGGDPELVQAMPREQTFPGRVAVGSIAREQSRGRKGWAETSSHRPLRSPAAFEDAGRGCNHLHRFLRARPVKALNLDAPMSCRKNLDPV